MLHRLSEFVLICLYALWFVYLLFSSVISFNDDIIFIENIHRNIFKTKKCIINLKINFMDITVNFDTSTRINNVVEEKKKFLGNNLKILFASTSTVCR